MKLLTTILVFWLCSVSKILTESHDFSMIIKSVEESYSQVNDYTCKFSKKDYIDGKYYEDKNVLYKFMKPGFYYMKYSEGSLEGGEVIYAGEKYDNQIRFHAGGFWSFVDLDLDPTGSIAMKGNRHSILESDLGFVINMIKTNYDRAMKNGEGKIKYLKDEKVDGRDVSLYLAEFPKKDIYYAYKIYIYLDKGFNLPVKFKIYDKDGLMVESYEMKNLELNTGLTEKDFDTENPKYGF